MNTQLLEEIKRFRQMSNLPILENVGTKTLINENRGDAGTVIWRVVLETGKSTSEAEAKRLATITKMFDDYRIKLSLAGGATEAEELTLRRKVIDDVNDMVRMQKPTKEIVDFLATKIGKEGWEKINKSIEKYVDQDVKNTIIKSLDDPNDPIYQDILKDFNDEISERMRMMDEAGDSPLVKKSVLDAMKSDFINSYKSLLGLAENEGRYLDELFEKPYKDAVAALTSKESKTLTWQQSFMETLRNSPKIISEMSELFNLFYLSFKKSEELLEKEIEELVLAIEQGMSKDAGKLIADRVKVLIKLQGDSDAKYITLYNDLITKIKNAIPDTESGKALLARIEEIDTITVQQSSGNAGKFDLVEMKFKELEKLFSELEVKPTETFSDLWYGFIKKLKELFSFWQPLRKIRVDGAGKILESYKGWIYRFSTYLVTGTLSTFKEYMEQMSKVRTNYNIFNRKTRKVSGWGGSSIIDMYIRIWFRANVIMPLIINLIWGSFAAFGVCGAKWLSTKVPEGAEKYISPSDETYNKWCTSALSNFFRETLGDMSDTFSPILAIIDEVFGTDMDSTLDSPTLGKVFWEIWDMVIPFNTKIDDIAYWFSYDPKQATDDAIKKENEEDKNTTEEETVKKIDPELFLKKEKQVVNGKMAVMSYAAQDPNYTTQLKTLSDLVSLDSLSKDTDPMITYGDKIYHLQRNRAGWTLKGEDGYTYTPKEFVDQNMGGIKTESIIKKIRKILMENSGKKFGEDNFKHWKDTFTFKAADEKNPGQYKEVKINMEDVMDRINHFRKKYDEDDAFVRAVIDTHEDVVKVMFTKDLAHLQENFKPKGLAIILQQIRESRGEMEIWSVARPANGNWFLVKGDYTPNQLANMDLEKNEPQPKEKEVDSRTEDDLKKKEELAIEKLKNNEKDGIEELPKQVRDKVREKLSKGWTTEEPFFAFEQFYEVSEINTVFNDKIKIYKLEPSDEFFRVLVKESASVRIKKGFCKSLKDLKNTKGLVEREQNVLNHFIEKCENKYGNEPLKRYRRSNFDD